VAAALVGACGADPAAAPPQPSAAQAPELARRPARAGEIVLRGDASPRTHEPIALHGRYLVRFEQFAPEDPDLDFTSQTSFVADLIDGDERSKRLFRAAERSGSRRLRADGSFVVDVTFGDFPYVIRFTPAPARG
jgi:hypothetical protein